MNGYPNPARVPPRASLLPQHFGAMNGAVRSNGPLGNPPPPPPPPVPSPYSMHSTAHHPPHVRAPLHPGYFTPPPPPSGVVAAAVCTAGPSALLPTPHYAAANSMTDAFIPPPPPSQLSTSCAADAAAPGSRSGEAGGPAGHTRLAPRAVISAAPKSYSAPAQRSGAKSSARTVSSASSSSAAGSSTISSQQQSSKARLMAERVAASVTQVTQVVTPTVGRPAGDQSAGSRGGSAVQPTADTAPAAAGGTDQDQTAAGTTNDDGQSSQQQKKLKRPRKFLRSAGGKIWEDKTLTDWAPDEFRVFAGDLGNDVTEDILKRYFAPYPSLTRVHVVRDKRTGKTRGYGFLSFKDSADYVRAMREMNGRYVGSRPIKLKKSQWKDRQLVQVRKKERERNAMGML